MRQADILFSTLKSLLKAKGLSYRELGLRVGLSESSIKRIFSEHTTSLAQFDTILNALGLTFADLVEASGIGQSAESRIFTQAQEEELASDEVLFAVLYQLLKGRESKKIQVSLSLTNAELIRYLIRLEKLELIELHTNGRIRLRVHPHIG